MSDLFGGTMWTEHREDLVWGEARFRHRQLAGGIHEVEMMDASTGKWWPVKHPETRERIIRRALPEDPTP